MLDIILSPLAAFKRLKNLPERWSAALMAPVACAILLLAGTLAFTRNAMPVIGEAISPFVSGDRDSLFWLVATQVILLGTSYLLIAGLAVVVVVSLDTLIRPDENGRGKLAELVGLSFYSQVPYALVVLVVGFSWQPPAPIESAALGLSDARNALSLHYQEAQRLGVAILVRYSGYLSIAWLLVLLGMAWHVVSGIRPAVITFALSSYLAIIGALTWLRD